MAAGGGRCARVHKLKAKLTLFGAAEVGVGGGFPSTVIWIEPTTIDLRRWGCRTGVARVNLLRGRGKLLVGGRGAAMGRRQLGRLGWAARRRIWARPLWERRSGELGLRAGLMAPSY